MQVGTYFLKVRRMLLFDAPLISKLLASFHSASRAPCSCHSVSSWDRSSNFGALGLRSWGSPGQKNPSLGFFSNFGMTCNSLRECHTLDWSLHVRSLPEKRLRRLHVLKYATQFPCIRKLTFRWLLSQFLITPLIRLPWSIVTLVGNRSSFLPVNFLQHSHCTLVIILFGPFSRLFINLTMCEWALFTKPTTTLVEQAFWRVPFSTKWVIASSSKVSLARPSRHSSTGTSASGTSGSRWFSLILLHERIRRRTRWFDFSTLIHIVAETAIVSFHTLPVGFPLPTFSKNSWYTLLCSLILDHGVLP